MLNHNHRSRIYVCQYVQNFISNRLLNGLRISTCNNMYLAIILKMLLLGNNSITSKKLTVNPIRKLDVIVAMAAEAGAKCPRAEAKVRATRAHAPTQGCCLAPWRYHSVSSQKLLDFAVTALLRVAGTIFGFRTSNKKNGTFIVSLCCLFVCHLWPFFSRTDKAMKLKMIPFPIVYVYLIII